MSVETITVTINGAERRVAPGLHVAALLESLGLHPRLVVVEHNREILQRGALEAVEVREGDHLEIVHFVGGG